MNTTYHVYLFASLSCLLGGLGSTQGRSLLHVRLPHGLERGHLLDEGLLVFGNVLLDNQSPFIEPTHLEVQNLVAEIEVLDSFLIAVHHHVAAADIVQEDGVFN